MRNPDSETDMAPSDTSQTKPAATPVRDGAAGDGVTSRPATDLPGAARAPDLVDAAPAPDMPGAAPAAQSGPDVGQEGNNATVGLARIAWLLTVLACVITIAILAVEGYYGYALVTLAVAVSAGINLT